MPISQDLVKELIPVEQWFQGDSDNQVHLETSSHPQPLTP